MLYPFFPLQFIKGSLRACYTRLVLSDKSLGSSLSWLTFGTYRVGKSKFHYCLQVKITSELGQGETNNLNKIKSSQIGMEWAGLFALLIHWEAYLKILRAASVPNNLKDLSFRGEKCMTISSALGI